VYMGRTFPVLATPQFGRKIDETKRRGARHR
jgi:hypothetical protein